MLELGHVRLRFATADDYVGPSTTRLPLRRQPQAPVHRRAARPWCWRCGAFGSRAGRRRQAVAVNATPAAPPGQRRGRRRSARRWRPSRYTPALMSPEIQSLMLDQARRPRRQAGGGRRRRPPLRPRRRPRGGTAARGSRQSRRPGCARWRRQGSLTHRSGATPSRWSIRRHLARRPGCPRPRAAQGRRGRAAERRQNQAPKQRRPAPRTTRPSARPRGDLRGELLQAARPRPGGGARGKLIARHLDAAERSAPRATARRRPGGGPAVLAIDAEKQAAQDPIARCGRASRRRRRPPPAAPVAAPPPAAPEPRPAPAVARPCARPGPAAATPGRRAPRPPAAAPARPRPPPPARPRPSPRRRPRRRCADAGGAGRLAEGPVFGGHRCLPQGPAGQAGPDPRLPDHRRLLLLAARRRVGHQGLRAARRRNKQLVKRSARRAASPSSGPRASASAPSLLLFRSA